MELLLSASSSSFFSLPNIPSRKPKFTTTLNLDRHLVRCRRSDFYDPQQRFPSDTPLNPGAAAASGGGGGGGSASRVFTSYSIYKGKAALSFDPRAPEFSPLNSGAYRLSKEGVMSLQFAPAFATRQYDWSRKQIFSLSVVELGTLMALGAKDSCEFYHDPFKGKSEEGKIRKILKVEPLTDGSGHFFNLSVQNRNTNVDESIYIPVTRPEFTVLNSAFNFIIPYLLGWHALANSMKPENSIRSNTRLGAEMEWRR